MISLLGIPILAAQCILATAQPVTGVWKGKIRSTRLELKLVKKADSLVGTSYYYESKNSYRRYAVKGYFDDATNNVVWWDEVLLDSKPAKEKGKDAVMAIADFNCPGDGTMKLEGESSEIEDKEASKTEFSLEKSAQAIFSDEWDFVLENYTRGANNPSVIDSVAMIAEAPAPVPPGYEAAPPPSVVFLNREKVPVVATPPPPVEVIKPGAGRPAVLPTAAVSSTPEEKFSNRARTLQNVIPVSGDTVEMRFYDNAEIDGDSIAVFLNDRLLEKHIGLTDQPHTIKIPVSELDKENDLVMVAENLGSIPPNTSLMVVLVGQKRYEARLYADEHTSALVRFVKEKN